MSELDYLPNLAPKDLLNAMVLKTTQIQTVIGINLTNDISLLSNKIHHWNDRTSQKNSTVQIALKMFCPKKSKTSNLSLACQSWRVGDFSWTTESHLPCCLSPHGECSQCWIWRLYHWVRSWGRYKHVTYMSPDSVYKTVPLGTHFWPLTINGLLALL